MNIDEIRNVSNQVQKAFYNIRFKIQDNELEDSLQQAILTLPENPLFRLARFPRGCCVDASHVLAVILSCINYLNVKAITCIEVSNERDNHMWVDCDGVAVDITYGQDVALYLEEVLIADEHPYLNKSEYKITRHEPKKTRFAQYIQETYVKV